jgi:hypothetical protein
MGRETDTHMDTWLECLIFGAVFVVFAVILLGMRRGMERNGEPGRGRRARGLDDAP